MPHKFNHCFYLLMMAWLLFASSCSSRISTFGRVKIAKRSDSLRLKERIATIKSIKNERFEKGLFKGTSDTTIVYRLFKPLNSRNQKLPLIVFFHGSNAVGTDNVSQLGILAKLFAMDKTQAKYPAYVLAPQFPSRSSNYSLDQQRNLLTSSPQPCLTVALQLVDSLKTALNIDQNRIYVVGFSMGASTAINALALRPDLFAAGISVSGIPQFNQIAMLSKIPLWIIHGNADTENPFASDEQFYKEVSHEHKIRFWEMDNLSHNDIFSTPFLGNELPNWLFKNTISKANN
ncbi:phospholipase [Pedobacter petrophilus]|uniref:Phospholipase n=1 Tax=Pedobacter petrophilus TaxID=1908241 RepID=A0A7K0FT92_9SPHI|nr:alpha/beta hydrolase-fold protein [Pedobacter petrophilus]MRX74542.1 phospholipase [Pedobacter petrophilus]